MNWSAKLWNDWIDIPVQTLDRHGSILEPCQARAHQYSIFYTWNSANHLGKWAILFFSFNVFRICHGPSINTHVTTDCILKPCQALRTSIVNSANHLGKWAILFFSFSVFRILSFLTRNSYPPLFFPGQVAKIRHKKKKSLNCIVQCFFVADFRLITRNEFGKFGENMSFFSVYSNKYEFL